MANNGMRSQLDKFNQKYGKQAADKAVESKSVEQRIAEEAQEKKSVYDLVYILTKSVDLLSKEVQGYRVENAELRADRVALRQENHELKDILGKILTEVEEIRKVTVGSLYMDDAKKLELGMEFHKTPLQRYRSQQIKEKGFFEDPTDPQVLAKLGIIVSEDDTEHEVESTEEVVVPAVRTTPKAPPISGGKRGRIPNRVKAAQELINNNTLESGRYDWKSGGINLVFAILSVSEWKGTNVRSAGAIQKDVEARKAFQAVLYNKDRYGVNNWAELIAKFEEAN